MPGSATNRLRSIHAKSTTVRQLPAGRGDGPTKRATMRDQWHASTRHSYAVLPGSANYRLRSGQANSTTVRQLSRGRGTDTTGCDEIYREKASGKSTRNRPELEKAHRSAGHRRHVRRG